MNELRTRESNNDHPNCFGLELQSVHTRMHTHTHTHRCMHAQMHTHTHTHTHTCMFYEKLSKKLSFCLFLFSTLVTRRRITSSCNRCIAFTQWFFSANIPTSKKETSKRAQGELQTYHHTQPRSQSKTFQQSSSKIPHRRIHKHTHTHTRTCIHTHACTHARTQTHTHTHTHTNNQSIKHRAVNTGHVRIKWERLVNACA